MHHTDEGSAIVASFTGRTQADAAVRALHDQGFCRTWLAIIGPGGTGHDTAKPLDENPLRRWYQGDAGQSLYDALRGRGVTDDVALQLDDTIVEGNCVLVAEGANDASYAEELVAQAGGTLLSAPKPLRHAPGTGQVGAAADPLAAARAQAADKTGVTTPDLDINGLQHERDALRKRREAIVPVVREDVFVCRSPRVLTPTQ